MWVTNSGVVSRENDIGKQRQGRSKACGWTIHRCDNGLLNFQQVKNDLARLGEQGIELWWCHVLKPLDIPASAERPALAGEHHHVGLLIQSDIGKDVRQFGVQCGINGVEGLRPVQRHDQHCVLTCTTQRVITAVIHKPVS